MSGFERTETNNKDGSVTITTKYIVKRDAGGSHKSVAIVRTKRNLPPSKKC
jgi:hypothetical protein